MGVGRRARARALGLVCCLTILIPTITLGGNAKAATGTPTSEPSAEPSASATVPAGTTAAGDANGTVFGSLSWDVKDTDGNLVQGGTFTLEYRGDHWNPKSPVPFSDCRGTCSDDTDGDVLDRDPRGGQWLLEHSRTSRTDGHRVHVGENYRLSQADAPAGYEWVEAGSNGRSIDPRDQDEADWGGRTTHDFGTFLVRKVSSGPRCGAGYVYGVTRTGQLNQVDPGGSVTPIGHPADGVRALSGLGIGQGGAPILAFDGADKHSVAIWGFNPATGNWTNQDVTVASDKDVNNESVAFVGGAVDLRDGSYVLGGFTPEGASFGLWRYDPVHGDVTTLGWIDTSAGASSSSNGDLAFNNAGDLFLVRGAAGRTTIYSVSAAAMAKSEGGAIAAATTTSFENGGDFSSAAFDSTGRLFLNMRDGLVRYSTPAGTQPHLVASADLDLGDIATCSAPPTITVDTVVRGFRAKQGDQFRLSLSSAGVTVDEASTTGNTTGLQPGVIGPIPTATGTSLTFSEEGVPGTSLADYGVSHDCRIDGVASVKNGADEATGSIEVPVGARSIVCQFVLTPLMTRVVLHKDLADVAGNNPTPYPGWVFTAEMNQSIGPAPVSDQAVTQATGGSGDATWTYRFAAATDVSVLRVEETVRAGIEFIRASCVVTHADGNVETVHLGGPSAVDVASVGPGATVTCNYVNRNFGTATTTGMLRIDTMFEGLLSADSLSEAHFHGTYSCRQDGQLVASGTWTAQGAVPPPKATRATLQTEAGYPAADAIPSEAVCTVTEVQPVGATDLPSGSWTWEPYTVSGPVKIEAGAESTVTVTNQAVQRLGSVRWRKVDGNGALLGGSEWILRGGPEGIKVTDCTADPCTGADRDPAPGKFRVEGLFWAQYSLVESKAPAGYLLASDPHDFEIGLDVGLHADAGDIVNLRLHGPTIPLTGGWGRDLFTLVGIAALLVGGAAVFVSARRHRVSVS